MLRPFTPAERALFTAYARQVRHEVDVELGDLLLAVARGDDSRLPAVYDRFAVIGRLDLADRLRQLMVER